MRSLTLASQVLRLTVTIFIALPLYGLALIVVVLGAGIAGLARWIQGDA